MNEQKTLVEEQVGTFRGAAEGLIRLFEAHADGLRQMSELLEQRKVAADARAKELDAREAAIKDQEAKIGTKLKAAQDLASSRLQEKLVAQDLERKAQEIRQKAVADLKLANAEKVTLFKAWEVLLKEKNELQAQLAQALTVAEQKAAVPVVVGTPEYMELMAKSIGEGVGTPA
jgi:hypothetical protein